MPYPITRFEAVRNCAVVIGIITVALFWRYLHEETTVYRYFKRHLEGLYFSGYPLEYLLKQNLPSNLEQFLNLELSEHFAVLMMLPLRRNRTARIVKARFSDNGVDYWHSWVEFRFFGTWYMADPLWYDGCIALRPSLPSDPEQHPEQVYSHEDFWSLPTVQYFYQQCQRRESSYLLCELFLAVNEHYLGTLSDHLQETSGQQFIPIWFKDQQVINERIFDFLAAGGPSYRQPSESLILSAMREETQYRRQCALTHS